MTQDQYRDLSYKEKMVYDELSQFSRKLSEQLTALTALMEKLLHVATHDP